jgi:Cap4 SAVED domain
VHIQEETKTLWLGESKIYTNGKKGVKELVKDIKEHFKTDYLDSEFILISKKLKHLDNIPEKDYWLDLLTDTRTLKAKLETINIPLLCTYQSNIFTNHDDETKKEFIEEYLAEMADLKEYFDAKNDHPLKANLNIILLLFPIQNKTELVKALHNKLSLIQALGD